MISNWWAGGLVVALGWLTLRAADPQEEPRPAPLVAPAASWTAPKEPKDTGVALGKPIIVPRGADLVEAPILITRRDQGEAAILASTTRRSPRAAPPQPKPAEMNSPASPEPVVPNPSATPLVRGQSPDEPPAEPTETATAYCIPRQSHERDPEPEPMDLRPAHEIDTAEPAVAAAETETISVQPAAPEPTPQLESGSAFATDRLPARPRTVRASGSFESQSVFAADRAGMHRTNVAITERKRTSFAEMVDRERGAREATPPTEEESTPAAHGIIARTGQRLVASAAKPAKDETQEATTPAKSDAEATAVSAPAAGDEPEKLEAGPTEKSAKDTDAAAPKEKEENKPAEEPIEAAPTPRLVPQPNDCTNAVLGKPRVASSEEVDLNGPPRLYGSAEYLFWFTRPDHVPPLVTTGPRASNGILGQPGTVVLFGGPGTNLNEDVRQGGRFTVGYWLDPCQQCAVEGTFFFLQDQTTRFLASSDAFPLLARPFFRINTGSEFSEIVTRPDLTTGNVRIEAPTRLWGAELNARHNLCCGCTYRVDGLAGVRYLDLKDSIHITEDLIATPTLPMFANDHIMVSDLFDTHNQFFGGQVGVDTEMRRGRFFVDFRGKVALGDNHQTLDIQGSQTITTPAGNVQNFRGGLLALPSNIGHFTRDRFAVVPEVGLSVGYQVTEQLRVSVGYNALWWSNVLRAGEQIDRVLDETQIPNFGAIHPPAGQNRPAVLFKETDYWAQGITFSVEFRY